MKALIKELIDLKQEINILLLNSGKSTHIGFTYCKGKTPNIYISDSDGLVLYSYSYDKGKDLLIAMINIKLGLVLK